MAKRKKDSSLVHITSGKADKEDISFQWKIENFLLIKSSEDLIAAQKFGFSPGETYTKWFLRLEEEMDSIGMFLSLGRACPKFKAMVECTITIIKPDGVALKSETVEEQLFTNGDPWGSSSLIPGDDETLKQLLWEDGSLVIKMDLKLVIFKVQRPFDMDKEVEIFEKRELHQVSEVMTRMIDSELEAGKVIKVVSKDGAPFYANTAILSGRSPVFAAMFRGENWREGQGSSGRRRRGGRGSLVLEDLSGKTVKVLLHYLVGGVLLRDDWEAEDVILELTYAADKYQLEGLAEFLDQVLPEMYFDSTEVLGKLALLTKRLGMENAEKGLFLKLKEGATDINELVLNKEGSLLRRD